ncbi:AAA family ATPase [Methanomicrobiaceae archaeon CYW5]|uniref:CDC48 family AAA ATPase n=1 Tax=Methanovulcanius yangii TaxID=1789227 RepID=UPI0029CA923E|nr:CDC48 family AAA ATPase [Methanovulcanius yangii]MBT8507796.1 AAA family ATPase [Methanovulcanius yangii]
MSSPTSLEVTVKEAAHEDAGRGIARLSTDIMAALGLRSGDVIEIDGREKAAAIVWPGFGEDRGRGILRIDGNIRSNARVGIDEKVTVSRAEVREATKLIIQPTHPVRLSGFEQSFARLVEGRPVVEGQQFRVALLGTTLTFVITKLSPKGVAVVTRNTEIELREEVYKPEEAKKKGKELPDVHYEDIGGLGRELDQVREMIELPLRHPEIFDRLGIEPPKGVLLYGPPGTGKTLIAKAVANEVDAHFITLSGPEIMSKYYGESEGKLREVFEEAQENAPTIIFIDEIDSIAPKRSETKGEVEQRIVAQLLSLMDGLKGRGEVIVIAATNIPDSIDPALRRGGRFDREIEIGIPDKKGRLEIFQVHTRGVPLDFEKIPLTDEDRAGREQGEGGEEKELKRKKFLEPYAASTHGFVGADIALLVKEAAMHALRESIQGLNLDEEIPLDVIEDLKVTKANFDAALASVEPSAMREVLVEVPDVTWDDVGGLEDVKEELTEAVEWPLKYPEVFDRLHTKPPSGILLFGPPGTGKTLLAKAVANQSECNFISVKGPELLSKWVGESEKGVRDIFRKARQAAPSIIFFDEIDSLLPKRGSYEGSSHVTESVVSQILTEIDGLEELSNVTILGATNRPDMLDEAMMRPGRFDRVIYVPPPDAEARRKIFGVYLSDAESILTGDINVEDLVAKTDGYVGADIEALVREAKLGAMREFIAMMTGKNPQEWNEALTNVRVTRAHFDKALKKVTPSLDREAVERSEHRAWPFLFNEEERGILEKAASVLTRAGFGHEDDAAVQTGEKELRGATFGAQKNFEEIRKKTADLEELLT